MLDAAEVTGSIPSITIHTMLYMVLKSGESTLVGYTVKWDSSLLQENTLGQVQKAIFGFNILIFFPKDQIL